MDSDDDDDDDGDGDSDPLNITPTSRRTIPTQKRLRTAEPTHERLQVKSERQPQDMTEPKSHGSPSSSNVVSPLNERADGKSLRTTRPRKKRAVHVESEDDEEMEVKEETKDCPPDDEDHIQENKSPEVSTKQRVSARRKPTKGGSAEGTAKGRKGKAGKETKEVQQLKDEHNEVPHPQAVPQAAPHAPQAQVQDNHFTNIKRPRIKEAQKEEDVTVDVVGGAAMTPEPSKVQVAEVSEPAKEATPPPSPPPPSPPPPPQPTQPFPKKRKLPTIKKTKNPGVVAPLNPPVPPKVPAGRSGDLNADEVSKLPAVETRVPAANVGSADFDLRKPSVYAQLFKSVRS